jgi:cytoskeletal protein CcmA (bactofilin family)
VCKGKITGDIVAKARVELRAPAVINGSIQTPILFIEDGVLFNGAIEMAHGVCDIPREALLLPIEVMTPPNIKRVNG